MSLNEANLAFIISISQVERFVISQRLHQMKIFYAKPLGFIIYKS